MSSPYRSRGGKAALLLAIALFVGGIVAFGFGSAGYLLGSLAALAVILRLAVVHDRQHRERGEPPHAMWGQGDKNKPWGRRQ